ncbi:lipoprotein-releasing system transmembrane protein LolC [Mizugakiibacter sediminis]|uniref:Lipoprotein-releasing system transmembrane protein LolC n=1 Tax=Mizugakiibacter sediminis TaxID=1475481 RepID=A0A0K8QLY6_9GAMM|nr:hypothetical protein [Mizugakiibacter sediminis]GAP65706.1 lipoprotein-releasing system transmembrane protein LolC [Mizugakiibacter sediminis]
MSPTPFPPTAAQLRALPHFAPDPALWPRIAARAQRRQARRTAAAACCMLLLAGAVGTLLQTPRGTTPLPDWQARSAALERELAAAAPRGPAPGPLADALVGVDRALHAAYVRGAPPAERAALWQARSELLESLVEAQRSGLRATRI